MSIPLVYAFISYIKGAVDFNMVITGETSIDEGPLGWNFYAV